MEKKSQSGVSGTLMGKVLYRDHQLCLGSYLGLGVVNWKHWEATGGRICREKDPGFNR